MDFSLSRVLVMFEARFGEKPTSALVGLAALALAAVFAKAIVTDFVLPVWQRHKAQSGG